MDPSYVSRVARGERKSAVVEKALAEEVRIIREHLNDHENNHNHNHKSNPQSEARVSDAAEKEDQKQPLARTARSRLSSKL